MKASHPLPPPPPIDSRELRPSRTWYVVAGVIAAVGVVVGMGLFGIGMISFISDLPTTMQKRFDAGAQAEVKLAPGQERAIYVMVPEGESGPALRAAAECSVGGDGGITLKKTTDDIRIDADRQEWQLVYYVRVDQAGTHQLECGMADGAAGQFAVGAAIDMTTFGKLFGSIGALLGLPCLGLVVGGIVALVAAMRRNSHKKRLQQERLSQPYAPGG